MTNLMYLNFANVLVFLLLGMALCGLLLGLGRLVRPSKPEADKLATYECGEHPQGGAWINFNIRFYIVAVVFLIFDVEIAFIYPVAVVFRDWIAHGRGLFALAEILLFVGVLFVGLVYVWASRDFQWLKGIPAGAGPDADLDVRQAAKESSGAKGWEAL